MKKFFLILLIFTSIVACDKDDAVKVVSPEEQAKIDNDQTIEYMKSNKFIDLHVGKMVNNIDWKIVPLDEGDSEETKSLFDLMGENVINTKFNGVDYKMYYYVKDTGKGSKIVDTDIIDFDYNVFSLSGSEMSERIDHSLFTIKFDIQQLIKGWGLGLVNFNSGIKPSVFPGEKVEKKDIVVDCDGLTDEECYELKKDEYLRMANLPGRYAVDPYREKIDTPGRGIFLVPSGLAYGSGSGVLRFDVVIYDNIPVEE